MELRREVMVSELKRREIDSEEIVRPLPCGLAGPPHRCLTKFANQATFFRNGNDFCGCNLTHLLVLPPEKPFKADDLSRAINLRLIVEIHTLTGFDRIA